MMNYESYRDILKEEYQKKIAINPAFSMRAFAKKLDLAPSRLSEILNEKQGLSLKSAQKITTKLRLDPHRKKYFELLVQSQHAKSKSQKEIARDELNQFIEGEIMQLPLDQYQLIAGWYHSAILELLKTENIVHSHEWIAQRLKISTDLANSAIQRLKRLKFINYLNGKFEVTESSAILSASPTPKEFIRDHHRQLIDKAKHAIDHQEINQRELSSLIIAINEEERDEIILEIRKFADNLNRKYSYKDSQKTKVYALSCQFFELGEQLL